MRARVCARETGGGGARATGRERCFENEKVTDRQTDRQKERQTDRYTETKLKTERESERQKRNGEGLRNQSEREEVHPITASLSNRYTTRQSARERQREKESERQRKRDIDG